MAKDLLDQSIAAGRPVFMKQMGAYPVRIDETDSVEGPVRKRIILQDRKGASPEEWPACLNVRQQPEGL
jgi:hypothetical protein